ncbi:MAG TPA: NUDIX hydrolase [Gammaproteobacteria bacterium]|nr:NUDIX hydrolase [Gammaproteobacteria bacterium]
MKFCSECGSPIQRSIPQGDNRARHVCTQCGAVHYQNPKIVAGCIAEWDGRILLCKRAIEPRYGLWTLPAGFMENDETVPEAAARETLEEANARVDALELYTMLSLPHANQVYMMFRARLLAEDYTPTHESLEVKLCDEVDIPWDRIAFPTILHTLKFYYEDRRAGGYRLHTGDIVRIGGEAHFHPRRPPPQ